MKNVSFCKCVSGVNKTELNSFVWTAKIGTDAFSFDYRPNSTAYRTGGKENGTALLPTSNRIPLALLIFSTAPTYVN